MKNKIKQFIFRALDQMDGQPMTRASLDASVRLAYGERVLDSDIATAVRDLESQGYISGQREEALDTITWTLTPKGKHKAAELA